LARQEGKWLCDLVQTRGRIWSAQQKSFDFQKSKRTDRSTLCLSVANIETDKT
jgi:hypothetical protein